MKVNKKTVDFNWKMLYEIGGIAALVVIALIPIQIVIFVAFPPPENPIAFFTLFQENWFLGLLSLDLLYILNNSILILMYLGLFAALRNTNFAYMLIAIIIGMVGIAAYYSSTVAFEMLSISRQYQFAREAEVKSQLISVAYGLLARYKGTAFDVYYVLNAITLLIISRVMFQDDTFTRATAFWGLISGVFMIIPSTAGQIGLIFSLLSLIPWTVFSVMVAKRLFILARQKKITTCLTKIFA